MSALDLFSIGQSAPVDPPPSHSRPLALVFAAVQPWAFSLKNSNRQSYEKLEVGVSYRKQSPEVISNRQENALHPRYGGTSKEKGSAVPETDSKATNPANTISARKLGILVSAAQSVTSEFLIDKVSTAFEDSFAIAYL